MFGDFFMKNKHKKVFCFIFISYLCTHDNVTYRESGRLHVLHVTKIGSLTAKYNNRYNNIFLRGLCFLSVVGSPEPPRLGSQSTTLFLCPLTSQQFCSVIYMFTPLPAL